MKSTLSVKMLSAVALVLLVFGVIDGQIVSKCELKEQLEAAQIQVIRAMGDQMTVDKLIAMLVCKASASGFNTSFVRAISASPKETESLKKPKGFGQKVRPIRYMYGLFQLSDELACDSDTVPSLNVCNISCSAFTDNDITDDIICLKTLINSIKPQPKPKPDSEIFLPLATLNTILLKECRFVVPSLFFSECLNATSSVTPTA